VRNDGKFLGKTMLKRDVIPPTMVSGMGDGQFIHPVMIDVEGAEKIIRKDLR
jgi:hypothetical protein